MFRKISVALTAVFLLSSSVIFSAEAASKISNGVACSKRNATTKVGSEIYRCTTNPVSKSKNLVWMSKTCLDTTASYASEQKKSKALIDSAETTLKDATQVVNDTKAKIQDLINNMIVWRPTKSYLANDVVYLKDGTYYVALTSSNNFNQNPSTTSGTYWAIYKPTTDPKIGTAPDATDVITWKQKEVIDWQDSLDKMNKAIKRIQGLQSPSKKDQDNLKNYQGLVKSLDIGITAAKTKIKTMQTYLTNLGTQNALVTTANAQKTLAQTSKGDLSSIRELQLLVCEKGR